MSKAENGSSVSVHYTGKLSDGRVFDSSVDREPLQFVVGKGEVIPGFENAVIGMAVGDSKSVAIPPEEGYGPRHDQMVTQVKLTDLPEGAEVGTTLQASVDGVPVYFNITEIIDEMATLDANHPLAGEELQFEIELLELS